MDERKYNVIFKGEIHEQATLSLVQERLSALFKADIEKIKIMFSKKRTIVKKNVSYEVCQKVEQGFLNAGAYIHIEEVIPPISAPAPDITMPVDSADQAAYPPPQEPGTEYRADPDASNDPNYAMEQETVYPPENGYVTGPPPGYESENVAPVEGYDQEPIIDNNVSEAGYDQEPIPEDIAPAAEYEQEPVFDNALPAGEYEQKLPPPDTPSLQPLEMEEKTGTEEVVPEPDEMVDEPSFGYAPLPEYEGELQSESEVRAESNIDSNSDTETEIEQEPDLDTPPDSESEPDLEIVEDESQFEIVGGEPDLTSEFESGLDPDLDSDPDFEFGNIDSDDGFIVDGLEENVYAAPQADLEQDEFIDDDNFVYPQKLPYKNGINWLLGGFALVKHSPSKWIGSVFIFWLISAVVGIIPFIGGIITNILNPVFLAGFMIGAREQDQGNGIRIGHVFAGFSNNFGQLVLFGLLYFVTILLIFGFIGVVFVLIFVAGGLGHINITDLSAIAGLLGSSPMIPLLIILVAMFFAIPIMMAYYFGPALIAINRISIFDAIKMSFKACLSNMIPFLLYGLAALGVFIVFALVLGGIIGLFGFLLKTLGYIIGIVIAVLMAVLIMPIFLASTYAAYKDIFYSN